MSGSRPAPATTARTCSRAVCAAARSAAATRTTSAQRATTGSASGSSRTTTSGWACGLRGVIDGPFTEKNSPTKSM